MSKYNAQRLTGDYTNMIFGVGMGESDNDKTTK